ncbi:MAG: sulfatase-like hydrolase/transferase [Myxococcota bacterium]
MASAPGNLVSRLAAYGTRSGRAGAVTWALLATVAITSGARVPDPTGLGFLLGVLGLWTGAFAAFVALGATAVARLVETIRSKADAPSPAARPEAKAIATAYALVLAIAGASFVALRPGVVDGWLPPHFTDRAPIVLSIRLVAASALGFGLGIVWFWIARRRPRQLPVWLVGVHYLALRLGAADALSRVFARNTWLLELVGLLVLFASAWTALGPTPSARVRRIVGGAAVLLALSAGLVLVGYGRWGAPRAALRAEYPAVADIARMMQMRTDLDGDGFAGSFGGLDCDDDDPMVSPAAPEIIGNGIDDNCQGGDLAGPVALPVPTRRGSGVPRSLVLVTVDAFRADHVDAETTPNLVAFAERSAWFPNTYAQAPFTDNSVRSFMTGRLPMDFDGVTQFFGQEPSIAELLAASGYATHAIQINALLTPYAFMGFAEVDASLTVHSEAHDGITSDRVADLTIAALSRLRAQPQPFFLWVHFFDPHADYVGHAGTPFSGTDPATRYRQEVWWTDRHVGRVLDELSAARFSDEGIVVVTSDHGELLGEHGAWGHANWLYEEAVRVPLAMQGPGVPAGHFGTRVRLLDLYPTLLGLASGIEADSDGASLQPVWEGAEVTDRDVFARGTYGGNFLRAAWVGEHKLIQDLRYGVEALYALGEDAGEATNLIDDEPATASALRDALGGQWDRSLNDAVLQRKQALFGSRQVDPAVWAAFDLAVQKRDCARGKRAACARLP